MDPTTTPLPPISVPSANTEPKPVLSHGEFITEEAYQDLSKPAITQRQANYHVHVEGLKAEAAARDQGTDPEAVISLLNAATGGKRIGQHTYPPATGGFILMLASINEACARIKMLDTDAGNMMAMAFALVQPELMWRILSAGDDAAIQDAVWAYGANIPLEELQQISAWVLGELERMKGDAEEKQVGK